MTQKILIAARNAAFLAVLAAPAVPIPAHADQPVQMAPVSVTGSVEPSLTVPTTAGATEAIERTPGAVEVVPDTQWKDTAAQTLKDVLDYTPGVWAQPKWGEDTRLSIRGSGLSRNFHMRGVLMYQDGVPINSSDGSSDFQELDPTAYRYVEVYKGANGLRHGANTLGGVLNFVTPTGYDADVIKGRVDVGSFGFNRVQASTSGHSGQADGYLTASRLQQDGFRDHSGGLSYRAAGNAGWRFSEDLETRFYLAVADIHQNIPGSVTKTAALTDPKAAAATNVSNNYQRNIESLRLANKTSLRLGPTTLEAGGYMLNKNLYHPIFQVLDYDYYDFGAYTRAVDERQIAGHGNRLTVGVNVSGGWVANTQSTNSGGNKAGRLSASSDRAFTLAAHAENAFDLRSDLTLVAGLQAVHTTRRRNDRFDNATDTSGETEYNFANPKVGVLWQVKPDWQVFANLSRSTEAPTFSELNYTNTTLSATEAQEAVTLEIGTRGRKPRLTWDLAAYRAHLDNEFQFFDIGNGNFQVTNADETVHQGIEAGAGWAFLEGLWQGGDKPDRLWLNASYTLNHFTFDDDATYGNNSLPGAPRHFIRAEVLYKHPQGFYAGPNLEWVPQAYYVDNANTVSTKAYALLGFRAGYDFNRNFSVYLDARNLTDETYIASASVAATATDTSAFFEPGTGRAVFVGLHATW